MSGLKRYIKYLMFCKKHKIAPKIPDKYKFFKAYLTLDGMELNENIVKVREIVSKLILDPHCPCMLKQNENTVCACLPCRTKKHCCCGLYVRKD